MSETDDRPPPGLSQPSLRTIVNPVMQERVTFDSYSVESKGAFTATTIVVTQVGGGPPGHYHTRMRETFTAGPKGCGFELDGKTRIMEAGERVVVLDGQVHRFFNHLSKPASDSGSTDSKAYEVTISSKSEALDGKGTENLEKSLSIAYGLARDGLVFASGTPKNPIHIAIVSGLGDINLPGLAFSLASPVLKGLHWYAQQSGEEQSLLDKYWYGS